MSCLRRKSGSSEGVSGATRREVTLAKFNQRLARVERLLTAAHPETPLAPSRAIDGSGDRNSGDHRPAAPTGDSAQRSHDLANLGNCPAWQAETRPLAGH